MQKSVYELWGGKDNYYWAAARPCVRNQNSKSRIPLAASVLDSLARWRRESPYAAPEDWIFASPRMKGKKPYWDHTVVANHLKVSLLRRDP